MPTISWPHVLPVLLLIGSNLFMTLAWYGHLRFKSAPLLAVIFVSWLIALVEYTMAVPANRLGHSVYSAAELKTIQEVITLTVFVGFAAIYLKEPVTIRHLIGFALIAAGAAVIFFKR
ncbi:MAG: DMT family protein [Caulobacterales bacterium]|uniref:DMT family protein n=1 Tax=Glycocaulis sp. TaxID=1969725 RepID=UPI003F9F33CC